jgi:hypothetical protein
MARRFTVMLSIATALLAVTAQPAPAALTAKVSVATKSGASRVVAVLSSTTPVSARARPKSVTVVAGGRSYRLSRTGASAAAVRLGTWRSKAFKGAAGDAVKALAGAAVNLKVRTGAGTRKITTRVAGGPQQPGAGGGTGPGQIAPINQEPAAPLFAKPASPSTGQAAFDAIKGYFGNSRFTDCAAGWPNCGVVEERYSHFENGDQYYCRLGPTPGSDIKSYGQIIEITGAEQNADGSWGVEYFLSSYGNRTFYSWRVAADGSVAGQYWGPDQSPSTGPATQQITGLAWVRGAKDCSV